MSTKDAKIATFLAAALAIGVLVRAPFVSTAAMYAQVSDSSRRMERKVVSLLSSTKYDMKQ